jgi:hypothetical protein
MVLLQCKLTLLQYFVNPDFLEIYLCSNSTLTVSLHVFVLLIYCVSIAGFFTRCDEVASGLGATNLQLLFPGTTSSGHRPNKTKFGQNFEHFFTTFFITILTTF